MDSASEITDSSHQPLTLPSPLDVSSLHFSDPRLAPFSPTSPGKTSPGRPKTMKEYEEELVSLKKENFNLKVRVYFWEKHRTDTGLPEEVEELQNMYTNLKIEYETQKKDLSNKEDLLLNTYRAMDVQKKQIGDLEKKFVEEKQGLLNQIESLEKELKEYQVKFMETSVQMDDTNAMYALTFGLNNKQDLQKGDGEGYSSDNLLDKVQELEAALEKAQERECALQKKLTEHSTHSGHSGLQQLHDQVAALETRLAQTLRDKEFYETTVKEAASQAIKKDKEMHKRSKILAKKEEAILNLEKNVNDLEKQLKFATNELKQKEKKDIKNDAAYTELQAHTKALIVENSNLKHEIKLLQRQLEGRSDRREQSRGSESDGLRETQECIDKLQRENDQLKNPSRYPKVESIIHTFIKENKRLNREINQLKKEIDQLKANNLKLSNNSKTSKEEVNRSADEVKMTSEKNILKEKVEELVGVVKEKENQLQEYKAKLDSIYNIKINQQDADEKSKLQKELEEQKKQIDDLKKENKKGTYNLQGLVNKELWDKNREIEKLNKVCERQQKQLREYQLQSRISLGSPLGIFANSEETRLPATDPLTQLTEDKMRLTRKVEELQARLLNTPERDKESLLVQNLRTERDQAEKLHKEAVNACVLLTTRLQELADFLDSLLPFLGSKKRKVVEQAVQRSRELSRSLSLAAEESSLMQCSTWTDLQPSLYIPLLPDISTVDFWSEDEGQEDTLFGGLKQPVVTDDCNQKSEPLLQPSALTDSFIMRSVFEFDAQNFENQLVDENPPYITDITESLVDTCSDHNQGQSEPTKLSAEVKSVNIGKITLTSRRKEPSSAIRSSPEKASKPMEKEGLSEYETWSEPDRDVSYARMGLKEDASTSNKCLTFNFEDTSETAEAAPKSPSSRRASEIQRQQRKIRSLEQMNEALRSELVILYQLTPAVTGSSRQDKATSISELSRQSIPSHLLEEIRNQREKLEASLFHNDYLRRQLETAFSLRKTQGDDDKASFLGRLKEVTDQLELAETELSELKGAKEEWTRQKDHLEATIQQNTNELLQKQCMLLDMEKQTAKKLNEVKEEYNERCLQAQKKNVDLEQKCLALQKDKDCLLEQIMESNKQITQLCSEVKKHEEDGKKNKQVQEDLNQQLQQIYRQKDSLQNLVKEQEQLLADAERERQELATQLIARDHTVSELERRLGVQEQASSDLEAALRSQLDLATQQCGRFEAKIRDLDTQHKQREAGLQRQLDAARFDHSEAVLQYTRAANDNIRMQQELRRSQPHQADKMKGELEQRVGELEAVNTELENRLASLHVVHSAYSNCDADSVVGSPRRPPPPPLYIAQRSHDLTSDYHSYTDQDAVLSSPQTHTPHLWFPPSSPSHPSASPDLGIDSDHGRFSSLDTHTSRSTALGGIPADDLMKLTKENSHLRENLHKTRQALEQTLAQLTAANQHKQLCEAQLSAANQRNAKVERAICRQIFKTNSIIKKAKTNLENDHGGLL